MQGFSYFGFLGTNGSSLNRSSEERGVCAGLWTAEAGKVTGATLLSCHGMRDIKIVQLQPSGFLSLVKVFPHFWGEKGSQRWLLSLPSVFVTSALLRHASIRKKESSQIWQILILSCLGSSGVEICLIKWLIYIFFSLTGLSQMLLSARHADLEQPNPLFLVWN